MTEATKTPATAKTEKTPITMSDGRIVDFTAKQKLVKESLINPETGVIITRLDFRNGQTRSLDARSLFGSQQFATSVYRAELASRLEGLGYELERGKHGQPEIKGYSQEYLEASSPRREQIKDHLRAEGLDDFG